MACMPRMARTPRMARWLADYPDPKLNSVRHYTRALKCFFSLGAKNLQTKHNFLLIKKAL